MPIGEIREAVSGAGAMGDLSFIPSRARFAAKAAQGASMLSLISGILIICVVGALCFWAIDRFVNESRPAIRRRST
ncbi:hypothetical protein [Bradyrhizobium sp. 192]|uniref:hypothetical protein n=1 Tax=Bradyrhizobium sp. 192 TaxID=2782660 RepID=UPI001FFF4EB7|nr:hypothetical protein [Bradyrhizobium sp. 192]